MRFPLFGLAAALGALALGSEARAQAPFSSVNDPFFAYYGFYLPRQQALANQPGPEATINAVAADRQAGAATNRNDIFDPRAGSDLFNSGSDLGFNAGGRQRSISSQASRIGGNTNGQGPQKYYNTPLTRLYYPGLKRGQNKNANVSVTRSRGFSGGRGGGASLPGPRLSTQDRDQARIPGFNKRCHLAPHRGEMAPSEAREGCPTVVPDQQRLSPEERSNLVAYLDGELNDAESRSIAAKLTQSMTARRELELLQKTWDLLDLLPRPKASEDFTARTLTVADGLIVVRPLIPEAAGRLIGRLGQASVWGLIAALLFGLGYLLTVRALPNPTARLARDLSIAESLEDYRAVRTMDYLKQIDLAQEFD